MCVYRCRYSYRCRYKAVCVVVVLTQYVKILNVCLPADVTSQIV